MEKNYGVEWISMFYNKTAIKNSKFDYAGIKEVTIDNLRIDKSYKYFGGISSIYWYNRYYSDYPDYQLPKDLLDNELFKSDLYLKTEKDPNNISIEFYLILSINSIFLDKMIENNNFIPNSGIIIDLFRYHYKYNNKTLTIIEIRNKKYSWKFDKLFRYQTTYESIDELVIEI